MGRKSIAEIRRKEITEAFFKVVAEKGLARATIREITEVAGFSQGMLHHYFANKEAMILEVMDYVVTTYMAEFQEGISRYKTATDRMKFFFAWFSDPDRFTPDFCRAWMEFWGLAKTDPAIAEALQGCYREMRRALAGIVRDGMKSGEFRKGRPVVTANAILAGFEGSMILSVVDPRATPARSTNKHIAEVFLGYLTGGE